MSLNIQSQIADLIAEVAQMERTVTIDPANEAEFVSSVDQMTETCRAVRMALGKDTEEAEVEKLRQEVSRLRVKVEEDAREQRRLNEEVERLRQEVTRLGDELQAAKALISGDEAAAAPAAEKKYERPDHGELKRLLEEAMESAAEVEVASGQYLRPDALNQGNPLFVRVEGLEEELSVDAAVARAVGCMQGYIVCP
eukprot:Hpha_TRINITY_DN16837_c2_g1::TRINITY_DN16837_c2_g1_i7::g.150229::m.150229